MAIHAFKCESCGAPLPQEEGRFIICKSCGTPYERDKPLAYYELTNAAEKLLMNPPDFPAAQRVFNDIIRHYPGMYRGWWGLVECETQNFTILDKVSIVQNSYDQALKFASDTERAIITQIYNDYIERQHEKDDKRAQEIKLTETLERKFRWPSMLVASIIGGLIISIALGEFIWFISPISLSIIIIIIIESKRIVQRQKLKKIQARIAELSCHR